MLAAHVETSPAESPMQKRRIHVASHLSHHNAAADYPSPPSPAHEREKRARAARDTHTRVRARTRALTHRVSLPPPPFPPPIAPTPGTARYNRLGRFAFT